MVLGGKEGLKCKVFVDGTLLEHVSVLKYMGCVLNSVNQVQIVVIGDQIADAVRSLVNTRGLYEALISPVLLMH